MATWSGVDRGVGRRTGAAFGAGAAVGVLGGLVGLGGAEFRLPLLLTLFRFAPLEAVILNKVMSLVVVTAALPARAAVVPLDAVAAHWPVALNLLAGSLVGAWLGAGWATRLRSAHLQRAIALLLVAIAAVLLLGHDVAGPRPEPLLTGPARIVAGVTAGLAIGAVASILGVAGGELLIPTLVLLYGLDVKLAGSLSLAVSLPTMLAGFARYGGDRSFATLGRNQALMLAMAAGSIAGSVVGGLTLGAVPGAVLLPGLAALLLVSALKVWRAGAGLTPPV